MIDKQLRDYYIECGIYEKYHNKTFDQFDNDLEALQQIQTYLKKVKDFRLQGVGLYLYGDNGVGKTHLLNCAFKKFIELRYRVTIISFSQLITDFTSGWYNEDDRNKLENLKRVDFLGIEEIGKEFKSKESTLALTVFDNILRYRLQSNKPTWITSNVKPSLIKDSYSEDVSSMLREAVITIQVTGDDYRNKIREQLKKAL